MGYTPLPKCQVGAAAPAWDAWTTTPSGAGYTRFSGSLELRAPKTSTVTFTVECRATPDAEPVVAVERAWSYTKKVVMGVDFFVPDGWEYRLVRSFSGSGVVEVKAYNSAEGG